MVEASFFYFLVSSWHEWKHAHITEISRFVGCFFIQFSHNISIEFTLQVPISPPPPLSTPQLYFHLKSSIIVVLALLYYS
jgi:hypothetical protein